MSLWPFATTVAATALLAGGIAVPAARKAFLGSVEHDWLADELDLDSVLADGSTVKTKNGTVALCIEVIGESYETKPEPLQLSLHLGRTQLFNQLGEAGISVRIFGVKRRRVIRHESTWPSPILKHIGDAEADLFASSYSVHWFVMIGAKDLAALELARVRILPLLKPYHARTLKLADAPDQMCDLTGFLNYVVTGDYRHDLPPISSNLSSCLPSAEPRFDKTGEVCLSLPTPTYHRLIVITRWPEGVDGCLGGLVMALDGEVDVTQVCLPISKDRATLQLDRKIKESATFGSALAAAEMVAAALHKSGIAATVIENTATFIFFPNPQGRAEDYEVFNLNDEQKGFIFNTPAGTGRRVLVVKREASENFEESVILDVDLGALDDGNCKKYFRAGTDAIADLERLQAEWRDQWAQHL